MCVEGMPRREFLKQLGLTLIACATGGAATKGVIGSFLEQPTETSTPPESLPKVDATPSEHTTQIKPETTPFSRPQNAETQFPPDLVFTGESHQYAGEAARIIADVKKDYGVSIISPKTWGEKNEPNLPYEVRHIACIAEAISQLPPEYVRSSRAPREILLLRVPGSTSEGAGGGYNSRRMIIYISETFDIDAQMSGPMHELYQTQRNHLRATVMHEYTHSFGEATPSLQNEWNAQVGWVENDDGTWTNQMPHNLIHDGGADVNPGEDIAVSAGLMFVNPIQLSEDRIDFFLQNEHYTSWPTIATYKENRF